MKGVNQVDAFAYIFVVCFAAIGITTIIGVLAKGKRIFKYVPSIIAVLSCIGFFIKLEYFSSGFENLVNIMYALVAGTFFLTSLVTAVAIDIILKIKAPK